jgi:hypothetical protein
MFATYNNNQAQVVERAGFLLKYLCIFAALGARKQAFFGRDGPVAQLNRVFDYGSKGFRFES